jgi:hypothetical protein
MGKILGDLGRARSVPAAMGDKLGLYKAINEQGPMTPEELATKMNVAERYARVALPPGSIRVSRIRACHRQVHRTGGTGNGVRRA